MKQLKEKKRLYLNIVILLVLIIGLYTIYALVTLLDGNEAATKTEGLSLREALANASFNSVALANADMPMPSMDGKQVLFIDGSFYINANSSVADYVRSVVDSGVPAVVFGEGYESFRVSISDMLPSEKVRYTYNESNVVDAKIAAYGLKLYPQDTVYGMPIANMIEIAGSVNGTADVAALALEWASGKVSNETPSPFEIIKQQLVPAISTQWVQACQLTFCTGDDWRDYGRLNIQRTWYKLPEVDNNSCNFATMCIIVEATPGIKIFSSDWHNADAAAGVYGYEAASGYMVFDYFPTTSYLSLNASVPSARDAVVLDRSDSSEDHTAWWYDIKDNGKAGKDTCPIMSWLSYSVDGKQSGSLFQEYQAQYSKPSVWPWPWTFWKSPVITIETSGL